MIETLQVTDLEKYADNIYEAIIVIAKRARVVNMEQKEAFLREREEFDDDEFEYDDEEAIPAPLRTQYVRLPKPTTIALETFLQGKLKYKVKEPADEKEGSDS